jgi:type IV pilus assembly protein PilM
MASITQLSRITKSAARPRLACEIAADRVIAARANEKGGRVELYNNHSLPAGAVVPNLGNVNVLDGHVLRTAITESLAAVHDRSRDVIVVVPDAAVRVVMLEFDALPDKHADADAVIRFRLKKSLPFNVDQAALSYDSTHANGQVKVVAAVTPQTVLEEYESAFRDAGYSPGVVMPSMLAALGVVDADAPTLVVKVDSVSISVAVVDQDELRLLRTLENPSGTGVSGAQIAADVYPSVVFYEDTYGAKVERVLLGGLPSMAEITSALEAQIGLRVQSLVTARYLEDSLASDSTPPPLLAAVLGALVG